MSARMSEQLSQRYSLRLSDAWSEWLDHADDPRLLTGHFHVLADRHSLLEAAPIDIWPGFMLPDSLPVLSNDYGDWWCVRVGANNEIIEVIQWMHGGGDWLPVGHHLGEAFLWDDLQVWRKSSAGAPSAAHEYPPRSTLTSQSSTIDHWQSGLCETWSMDERHVIQLLQAASQGAYSEAVAQMAFHRWALEAAACELIEIALQGALVPLADPKLASHCGINWTPDFTSWLFDTDRIPAPARQLLKELSSNIRFDQDWSSAQKWTDVVLRKRQDLAWCGDVAGWAAEKNGDAALAAQLYFANRHSSAFTDQSVRLRSHWFSEHFGKFSIAQLSRLQEHLSSSDRDDLYLQTLWTLPHNAREPLFAIIGCEKLNGLKSEATRPKLMLHTFKLDGTWGLNV